MIESAGKNSYTVSCTIKNTGNYKADEVVQVYVQDDKSEIDRPLKELKGFARISLKQGEQQSVKILLSSSAFSYFSPKTKKWTLEPGTFTIHIGSSSADIRLKKSLTIK